MADGLKKKIHKAAKIFQYNENGLLSRWKVFLFIMGDLKLVQSSFIDAASHIPPPFNLLRRHSVRENNHAAAAAFASLLLILVKSRPTDDETFLPFCGPSSKRFLIFFPPLSFKAETNVPSFAFRGVRGSAYHNEPQVKTKGTTASPPKNRTGISGSCRTRRRRMR